MSQANEHKKMHPQHTPAQRSPAEVALVIFLFVMIIGLAILTINYNWHRVGKNKDADIFTTIKEKLSNVQVK